MSKKEKDGLVPSAQIGKQLIREAFADVQDRQKKLVVKEVSDIMERINLMERIASKTERRLKLCRDQMAAINAGKFKISEEGFAGVPGSQMQPKLKFDNAELNIDWSATERW